MLSWGLTWSSPDQCVDLHTQATTATTGITANMHCGPHSLWCFRQTNTSSSHHGWTGLKTVVFNTLSLARWPQQNNSHTQLTDFSPSRQNTHTRARKRQFSMCACLRKRPLVGFKDVRFTKPKSTSNQCVCTKLRNQKRLFCSRRGWGGGGTRKRLLANTKKLERVHVHAFGWVVWRNRYCAPHCHGSQLRINCLVGFSRCFH